MSYTRTPPLQPLEPCRGCQRAGQPACAPACRRPDPGRADRACVAPIRHGSHPLICPEHPAVRSRTLGAGRRAGPPTLSTGSTAAFPRGSVPQAGEVNAAGPPPSSPERSRPRAIFRLLEGVTRLRRIGGRCGGPPGRRSSSRITPEETSRISPQAVPAPASNWSSGRCSFGRGVSPLSHRALRSGGGDTVAVRAGGGAVLFQTTRVVASSMRVTEGSPARRRNSIWTASSPISRSGWWIEVSGGLDHRATITSSYPTTDRSSRSAPGNRPPAAPGTCASPSPVR